VTLHPGISGKDAREEKSRIGEKLKEGMCGPLSFSSKRGCGYPFGAQSNPTSDRLGLRNQPPIAMVHPSQKAAASEVWAQESRR